MTNLFNPFFWFNFRPDTLSSNSKIIMGAFIILMVATFTFLKIMKDRGYNSKFWSSVSDFAFTNTLLACLLLFFTTEFVPFFSARFWFIIWLAEIVLWLTLIFKRKKVQKISFAEIERQKLAKKYLPK